MPDETIDSLSNIEIEVLKALGEIWSTVESIVEKSQLNESQVRKAAEWLVQKELAEFSSEKKTRYKLLENGRKYAEDGMPEKIFLKTLKYLGGEVSLSKLINKSGLDKDEINYSLGLSRKRGFISMIKGNVKITILGEKWLNEEYEPETLLKIMADDADFKVGEGMKPVVEKLSQRKGIIEMEEVSTRNYKLTEYGRGALKLIRSDTRIDSLTSEIILSGRWKGKKFRPFNLDVEVPEIECGKKHFLYQTMEKIKQIFLSMGFQEMRSDYVETCFWNFDVMFFPQDHPDREIMDTFYLKNPKAGKIPAKYAKIIKQVQENGWKTGSKGRMIEWSEKESKKLILRCHTTQTSFRYLAKGMEPPYKFFSVDRVFRNETLDATHLNEFHQVEGFVVGEGLTLKNLMGNLKEFYNLMGVKKLKFKPTYNPYTEPSMEIFGYHPEMKKWIELGNSGMFRPETLAPYGINVPVIAWGLALERLATMIYKVSDIRQVLGHMVDLKSLKGRKCLTKVV